jgi:histidinol-phosphate/aromatic aminotransferase/cobyric acid decarboxylase-like protein
MSALRNLPESMVRLHPYGAAAQVECIYAGHLGQPASEFVSGRGSSDLIWWLGQIFHQASIGLPMPAYTEFLRAFPQARAWGGGPSTHALQVIEEAMRANDVVVLSNPHNPTGQVIQKSGLVDLANRYRSTTLVVDESYIDFLPDDSDVTMIGCDVDNVVVLRSPSKFLGLAGLRSGVAWSRSKTLRLALQERRTTWPISALAAELLSCAIGERTWAIKVRRLLADDASWLYELLAHSGLSIAPGHLHFRLMTGSAPEVAVFVNCLESNGILVRVLEAAHGVGMPAIRISAPKRVDRSLLGAALGRPG